MFSAPASLFSVGPYTGFSHYSLHSMKNVLLTLGCSAARTYTCSSTNTKGHVKVHKQRTITQTQKRFTNCLCKQNWHCGLEASWNVMAHAQKPDFVFRRNGRVHLNRPVGRQFNYWHSRGVRISGSNAGYTMFRGSVKSTGYPLHSPVFPSLLLQCVTVCHHISTGVYKQIMLRLLS